MAPSKLRQVVGAVKDQTSIGLAKVGASSAASELDVAIVKATRHSERFPAEERHVREILALSRGGEHAGACVSSLSRRLGRTRSWAVALKTLVVVHRLIAGGDPAVEHELLCATRHGTRLLNLSDFCDRSRADAWDFSAFVRAYAAYLDGRLELRAQARQRGGARPLREEMYMDTSMSSPGNRSPFHDEDVADADGDRAVTAIVARDAPIGEMTLEQLFTKANQLQHLLDRFIACRPVGAAKSNRVVAVSMYPVVRESVQLYCELTEVTGALIEQFPDMETSDCERVHELFTGLARDMDELQAFYAWCKDACVCRQSDVPEVEVVTHKKLELMDEFIRDRRAAEAQHQRMPSPEPVESPEALPFVEDEHDMNATKALPEPTEPEPTAVEEDGNANKTGHQPEPEPLLIAAAAVDGEADFLNLKADAMSSEAHGQQMALALFDGGNPPTGDAFDPSSADWETALVQSASALATQRAELGGGFDMMVLDGMYSHATASATVAGAQAFSGSASSVAMRPPGAPMLALPPPRGTSGGVDPFAASALVPPPMYVQMSDLQTKQQLLTQEQMVWQRYGKNGMQGPQALAMLEQRPHHQQQLMPHEGQNYYALYRSS